MKYLIEIDSNKDLREDILEYLELMSEEKYKEGEIDDFLDIDVRIINE